MARQVLALHWKASRLVLLPFVLASFGLPLLAVQGAGPAAGFAEPPAAYAARIVSTMELWLIFFPVVAAAVGFVLALTAWQWDHQGGHVYALTLPLARWRYALLKLGAGAALALVPAAAFLAGALMASASVDLPAGLRAYPGALTLRFLAATLVAYGLLFAMAAGTVRTTVLTLTGIALALVLGSLLSDVFVAVGLLDGSTSLAEAFLSALVDWPGPLHVFGGNWRLIDV